MKKYFWMAALVCAATTVARGGETKGAPTTGDRSQFDSLSYAIGVMLQSNLDAYTKNIPFDYDKLEQGIVEAVAYKASLDRESANETLQNYYDEHPDLSRFTDEAERKNISYAVGCTSGFQIRETGLPLQSIWVTQAMKEVRKGRAKMTADEAAQFYNECLTDRRERIAAENAAASAAWLEQVERQPGVRKTASGLLYRVLEPGDPALMPGPRDEVTVHYTLLTREGKVVDAPSEPATFRLEEVIPGLAESLQLIGKGGRVELWIPSELAYGRQGARTDIAPGDAIASEVELLDVTPYTEEAPTEQETEQGVDIADLEAAPSPADEPKKSTQKK